MRIRRASPEPRLEMAPLIDVVFLLLTFFVFAMVLMVRVDLLGIRVPAVTAGEAATPGAVVSISVSAEGALALDGETVALEELPARVGARLEADPEAKLFLVLDEQGRVGDLVDVVNTLRAGGYTEFSVVGRPAGASGASPQSNP